MRADAAADVDVRTPTNSVRPVFFPNPWHVVGMVCKTILLLSAVVCLISCAPHRTDSVSGTIETDEVHVASRYGGRVEKIFAREGDLLKTGELIVQLEASELPSRLERANALLQELVAGPRPQELATAKSEWEAQTTQLDLARKEEKRSAELIATHTISPEEYDRAVNRVHSLEKTAAAAKSRLELLEAGTRSERIMQAKADVAELETQVREMKVFSPTNTVLEVLSVKVGDVLGPNREVATLVLADDIWVRVYVPEAWLGYIKVGDTVMVKVDSFPNKTFKGTVEQIARVAEFTPRNVQTVEERMKQTFGIKIRLEPVNELRPGMSVDATFANVPESVR
ncbi:MAG: Secretion protein HlyD precursor [Verrucomicrobiales bacterium]|nr:Secretion protein HlyD precursor [Verrucomicrobiales bacterium]